MKVRSLIVHAAIVVMVAMLTASCTPSECFSQAQCPEDEWCDETGTCVLGSDGDGGAVSDSDGGAGE